MTDRLYYTDSYCREFNASVTGRVEVAGRPAVILDRTAFYPTSGGQPFDTGTLNGATVLETIAIDEDAIAHVVDAPLDSGTPVHGVIEWSRRFDHMQQHTGQHILSAAFDRLFGNPTVSFHMGSELSTIDLARGLTDLELEDAETEANGIVWDDRPVAVRMVSADVAATLPLRKAATREGPLRVVEVHDFDVSACGGTHVSRTGAIGLIAIVGWERFKGGARVSFACGGRALRSHRALRAAVSGCIRQLSVLPGELPAAVGRLQADAKEQRRTIKELSERLTTYEAAQLLAGASHLNGVRVLVHVASGGMDLKSLAASLTAHEGVAVVLLSSDQPVQVVVARSRDLALDAQGVLRALVDRFGGRGGGKPDLAQGGGLTGDMREMVWAASGLLEDAAAK